MISASEFLVRAMKISRKGHNRLIAENNEFSIERADTHLPLSHQIWHALTAPPQKIDLPE